MLEARLETLHTYGPAGDGVVPVAGVNSTKIQELAKEGWQLVTTITPRPSPEVIVGVFYRKVHEPETPAIKQPAQEIPKKPGRPRKSDA